MNAVKPQPGTITVIKRNGQPALYDQDRIRVAIIKAYMDPRVLGASAESSASVQEKAQKFASSITETIYRRSSGGGVMGIEEIQDLVELTLMRAGEHQVARYYIIYREERIETRKPSDLEFKSNTEGLTVTNEDGTTEPFDEDYWKTTVVNACSNLDFVDPTTVYLEATKALYKGISTKEIPQAFLIATRTMVESEPNYSMVTARLLLNTITENVAKTLSVDTSKDARQTYKNLFIAGIHAGVENKRINPVLGKDFDLLALAEALNPERDLQFTYLGLQTLADRYFLHIDDNHIEIPQTFYMRVAMGLAIKEDNPTERAIEFYNVLSSFDFMCSTPTLFNAGTLHSQLSSCYLTTVPDDMGGIADAWKENSLLSKWAGGLGNDWTPVRALGSRIKGTNGKSQGVVPFLKVANDIAVAVNQGGKRKGAACAYLETWHLDMEEFLELRKNTGDDRRRTHDMNTANWIPDLFMKRVMQEADWTLFSPSDCPDLHDLYGSKFDQRFEQYEAMTKTGEIKNFKTIPAIKLWRRMLEMLFETGHPWLTFKDPCNIRSPQQHAGVVHSSNLCTEITLNTNDDEIAVCNLGSVNLLRHVDENGINNAKLEKTITTAVRMLDNVIDINFYPVEKARNSNMRHRPIGLGLMGFQDALYEQGIPYGTEEAVLFADSSMESISYYAIKASAKLAEERGAYDSFNGSLWNKGIVPVDSIYALAEARGEQYLEMDNTENLDWESVRGMVKQGMRNSNVMAIAPTATIANIVGVTQSIEPTYQNLFVKSNLSGEFTVINSHLVHALRAEGLWDAVMVSDLKHYEGSLKQIERIPEHIKALFATAFEVDARWIIDSASRRQKWLDQSQSLNLYINEASGKKLDFIYKMAWYRGLKTTYYLRALAATSTEKSTVTNSSLNAVSSQAKESFSEAAPVPPACSIDNPDCESCT